MHVSCPVPPRHTTAASYCLLLPATCCLLLPAALLPATSSLLPTGCQLLLAAAATCCLLLLFAASPDARCCCLCCRLPPPPTRSSLFSFRLRNPNFCLRAVVALRPGEGKPAASDLRQERRAVGINVGGKISRVLPKPESARDYTPLLWSHYRGTNRRGRGSKCQSPVITALTLSAHDEDVTSASSWLALRRGKGRPPASAPAAPEPPPGTPPWPCDEARADHLQSVGLLRPSVPSQGPRADSPRQSSRQASCFLQRRRRCSCCGCCCSWWRRSSRHGRHSPGRCCSCGCPCWHSCPCRLRCGRRGGERRRFGHHPRPAPRSAGDTQGWLRRKESFVERIPGCRMCAFAWRRLLLLLALLWRLCLEAAVAAAGAATQRVPCVKSPPRSLPRSNSSSNMPPPQTFSPFAGRCAVFRIRSRSVAVADCCGGPCRG